MQQLIKNEFDTLVQADKENRRQAVLNAASELFASKETPSWEDALHFEELCLRLLPKLNLQARSDIAERLARCSALPKTIALTMAKDDIAVAAPLLHHYTSFNDTDLLTILARGSELHALAIAGRANLSDTVMLVISKKALPTFKTSVDYPALSSASSTIEVTIVDKSSKLEQVDKEEISSDVHAEMTAVPERSTIEREISKPTNQDNKARLDMDVDVEHATKRLIAAAQSDTRIKVRRKATSTPLSGLDRFLSMEHAHVLTYVHTAVEDASKVKVNPALILKQAYRRADRARDFTVLAREQNTEQFAALLLKECNLSQDDATRVIEDDHGFALAVCLKSLALPKHVANEAFLLLNKNLGTNKEQIFLLNWFYGQITPTAAHSVIEDWQPADTKPTSVEHKPVHSGKSRTEMAEASSTQRKAVKLDDTVQRTVARR
ncbi:MAG: DUF2336 domain-containing protein [Hyphomicrobiales bacterium]